MLFNVYNRFVASCTRFPERVAINCNGENYTYSQFAQIVASIRKEIKDKNTELIGVVTGDDVYTYASIIAVLSVGAAYVPINHKNPKDRNAEIINDAGLTVVLASKPTASVENERLLIITSLLPSSNATTLERLNTEESSLAYLFFTSGSTGKPKGVPIHHSNLNDFLNNVIDSNSYSFSENDRFIQMFELTFDLSVFSFLVPLSIGASCYVIPETGTQYLQIIKCLEEQKITVALLVPSVLNFLKPYFEEILLPDLKYSLFCGEALYEKQVSPWCTCVPNAIVQNVYGPTEATIFYTVYEWDRTNVSNEINNGIVSIGKPMGDLKVYIVDENNAVVEQGQTGELCLSGKQVTDKYYKDAVKTKLSFITLLVNNKEISCYKTGDVCYVNEKGNLIYCGRLDTQVKIQGHRVELSEIEFHSQNYPGVSNAVAVVKQDKNNYTYIFLFIEEYNGDIDLFIAYLKKKLPPYMIPENIKITGKFPLNLNGKIDKNKLKELV